MANPQRGEVDFEVDGKVYTLVFDFNAICEIEAELGVSMAEISERFGDKPKAADLRKLYRIGLSQRHPELTLEDAGRIITALKLKRAGEIMGEAFRWASEEPGEPNGEARPRPPAGD